MKIKPATAFRLAVLIVSCASFVACANTSHVLVYQHSNFGLNAGLNPSTQSTHIRVGMRNEFAIITPRLEYDNPENDKKGYKAASSYVATRFRVKDPFKAPEVAELVATGKAATDVGGSVGSAAFLAQ